MGKIDKSRYNKRQWKLVRDYRRKQKEQEKEFKEEQATQKIIEQHTEEFQQQESIDLKTERGNIAFVLGNGHSRKTIPLLPLKEKGKVYGCNALYREFVPDYLIAVDTKMILEINKSGYQRNHEVWTNPNKQYARMKGFNFFNPSKGWSSGPTALWLASEHGYDTIYILGFDYKGLNDGLKFNNIYADTQNYKKSTDSATFYGNWLRQTCSVIENNPKKRYIRVVEDKTYIPKDLAKYKNLEHLNINDFMKIIENF